MKIEIVLECSECSGEGVILSGPSCWKPASQCCGGCYDEHSCENCSGSGSIEVEFDADQISEIIAYHYNGEIQDAHDLVTEIIANEK